VSVEKFFKEQQNKKEKRKGEERSIINEI